MFIQSSINAFPARPGLRALLLLCCSALVRPAAASEARDFADLSIEQLMNETVTSVSKKEQSLFDAAAAVSLLSNDDLRRSGATTIPDALRLVPGLNVASVNSREQAISARGANSVYANKLLVLVDGRAVYTPLFAGVYWDLQQPMLADVDRVEVIRGPGATLWGANAVNGVINVVSRSARETQGALLYGGGGDVQQTISGVRYGGQIDEHTYYRAFGSYQSNGDHQLSSGGSAHDNWQTWHGGFRADRYSDSDTQLTWQAGATGVEFDDRTGDAYNFNTLGRWTRQLAEGSSIEMQAYYDRDYRYEPRRSSATFDTIDLSAQHTLELGARNDVIWGLGYRFIDNKIEQTNPFALLRDGEFDLHLINAFIQDELTLLPDKFTLTAGLKVEHNEFTGFEFQPSVRAVLKPAEHQTVWTAISRAVRTPSGLEGKDVFAIMIGAPASGPDGGVYVPTLISRGDVVSEVLWAYELGYRIQPSRRINVDLAAFYNDYSDIVSLRPADRFIPGQPMGVAEIAWGNFIAAKTYGGEAAVTVSPTDAWRLSASYSLLRANYDGPPGARTDLYESYERSSPTHQAVLRSAHDLTPRMNVDAQLRYVSPVQGIPAYITGDVRLAYQWTEQLELSLVGKNLLDAWHPEQGFTDLTVIADVPRSFYGKLAWRF